MNEQRESSGLVDRGEQDEKTQRDVKVGMINRSNRRHRRMEEGEVDREVNEGKE